MKLPVLLLALALGLSLPAAPALANTLGKAKDFNTLTLGVREASYPLSYLDAQGQPIGYHVELCRRIIDKLRENLKLPGLKVSHQVVTAQNRIPLLVNGSIDLECGSTTNSEARQQQVAFALTTFVSQVRLAVKKSSGIRSLADLGGKAVATTSGTTSVRLLRAHELAARIDFKEVYGRDHADAFQLLESGRAAAFVMDDNLLAGLIATSAAPADYALVGEVLSVEPIAIMLRKDPPFKKQVDDALRALMKSGELERIYAKWFLSPIPPKNINLAFPMSARLKALIQTPSDAPVEAFQRP